MSLQSIAKHVPVWTAMKSLGRNRVIQSSYFWLFFVPLAAKAMVAAPELIAVEIFGATIPIKAALPFSWKLFYISAICFAAGSLIYQMACPKGIKKYDNYVDYTENGKDSSSLITAFLALYRKKSWMWPLEIGDSDKNYFLKHLTAFSDDPNSITRHEKGTPVALLKAGIPEESRKAAYYYVIDRYDASRPILRALTAILFLAGFLFFGAVTIENIIFVYQHQ